MANGFEIEMIVKSWFLFANLGGRLGSTTNQNNQLSMIPIKKGRIGCAD